MGRRPAFGSSRGLSRGEDGTSVGAKGTFLPKLKLEGRLLTRRLDVDGESEGGTSGDVDLGSPLSFLAEGVRTMSVKDDGRRTF